MVSVHLSVNLFTASSVNIYQAELPAHVKSFEWDGSLFGSRFLINAQVRRMRATHDWF